MEMGRFSFHHSKLYSIHKYDANQNANDGSPQSLLAGSVINDGWQFINNMPDAIAIQDDGEGDGYWVLHVSPFETCESAIIRFQSALLLNGSWTRNTTLVHPVAVRFFQFRIKSGDATSRLR